MPSSAPASCPGLEESHRDALTGATDNVRLVILGGPVPPILDALILLQEANNYITHGHGQLCSVACLILEQREVRPRTGKGHLGEGKVLAYANARPTVEGHVGPGLGGPVVPALGAKDGRVGKLVRDGRVDVAAALHGDGAVDDDVVGEGGDVGLAGLALEGRFLDWRLSVGTAHLGGGGRRAGKAGDAPQARRLYGTAGHRRNVSLRV